MQEWEGEERRWEEEGEETGIQEEEMNNSMEKNGDELSDHDVVWLD